MQASGVVPVLMWKAHESTVGERHWCMQSTVATLMKRLQANFEHLKTLCLCRKVVKWQPLLHTFQKLRSLKSTVMVNERSIETNHCSTDVKRTVPLSCRKDSLFDPLEVTSVLLIWHLRVAYTNQYKDHDHLALMG